MNTTAYEIEFVLKDYSQRPQRQITHLGGRLPGGEGVWKITVQEAIQAIKNQTVRYFIRPDGGLRNYLILATHPLYGPFLTTNEDPREPKTLLAMPETLEMEIPVSPGHQMRAFL